MRKWLNGKYRLGALLAIDESYFGESGVLAMSNTSLFSISSHQSDSRSDCRCASCLPPDAQVKCGGHALLLSKKKINFAKGTRTKSNTCFFTAEKNVEEFTNCSLLQAISVCKYPSEMFVVFDNNHLFTSSSTA